MIYTGLPPDNCERLLL